LFSHYRQLCINANAQNWFALNPPADAENIVPIMATI
jgi:hypothetical protein